MDPAWVKSRYKMRKFQKIQENKKTRSCDATSPWIYVVLYNIFIFEAFWAPGEAIEGSARAGADFGTIFTHFVHRSAFLKMASVPKTPTEY